MNEIAAYMEALDRKIESYDNDVRQVKCRGCNWQGAVEECLHSWKKKGYINKAEGMMLCPECGKDDVIPLDIP